MEQTNQKAQNRIIKCILLAGVAIVLMIVLENWHLRRFVFDSFGMVGGAVRWGLLLLPIIILAHLYGPIPAAVSGAIVYVLISLFPALTLPDGRTWIMTFQPGPVLSFFIYGIILGILLRRRTVSVAMAALAALMVSVVGSFVAPLLSDVWKRIYFEEDGRRELWAPTSETFVAAILTVVTLFILIWLVTAEKSPISRVLRRLG